MHLLLPSPPFSPENQAVPWAAPDPEAGSAVTCERCHSTIISDSKLRVWKDLPSENWAEMMEFWHCHKPHDRDQQENKDLADKGYGANNNVISAQSGVGFVDIISFMFDERDCQNLLPPSGPWIARSPRRGLEEVGGVVFDRDAVVAFRG
ncbi:hypothetical protein E4U13_001775 [Claviceps humidiphila]|uniref:Uncharacterized protein n=1 Tax=Claviceps humidiphila TaxID=1294629 RepID=A0A9P7Q102_9HYPO|nr:hypothetical protein E4U13_001775 [Claviceps humidiphila]